MQCIFEWKEWRFEFDGEDISSHIDFCHNQLLGMPVFPLVKIAYTCVEFLFKIPILHSILRQWKICWMICELMKIRKSMTMHKNGGSWERWKSKKIVSTKNQCMKEWQGNRILQSCILAYISSQGKFEQRTKCQTSQKKKQARIAVMPKFVSCLCWRLLH